MKHRNTNIKGRIQEKNEKLWERVIREIEININKQGRSAVKVGNGKKGMAKGITCCQDTVYSKCRGMCAAKSATLGER